MRLALLSAFLLIAPALSAQPGNIFGYFTESSTGPYAVSDIFEATLWLYADSPTPVSMGTSTFVIDYNRQAMTFPGFGETVLHGASGNYQYSRYRGFRPTINGGTVGYTSDIRPNNVHNNRLTVFMDRGVSDDPVNEEFGELIPTTPVAYLKIRFTVVDPSQAFTITPKSQQFFDGPGGPLSAFGTGALDGFTLQQNNVAGNAGWRLISSAVSAPGVPLNTQTQVGVSALAAQNLVQGVPGFFPAAGANLFYGFDGTGPGGTVVGYGVPGVSGVPTDLSPGIGAFWYLYNQNITTGGPSNSVALPFDFTMSGTTELSIAGDNSQLAPLFVDVPLHSTGDRWNLVGNPAGFAINPTLIAPVGGAFTSSVVQVWDPAGSYVLSTDPSLLGEIKPGVGFFLQNGTATAMRVPTEAANPNGLAPDSDGQTERAAPAPLLAFSVSGKDHFNEPVIDRAASLTLRSDASENWDMQDAEKLVPLSPAYALLSFMGERNGSPVLKAQESRAPGDVFSVPMAFDAVGASGTFTMSWNAVDISEDLILALVDYETGDVIDMRTASSYQFTATESAPASAAKSLPSTVSTASMAAGALGPRFELSVGRFPVASAPSSQGAPDVLALLPASPNPFAATTRVRFEMPEAGDATLAVYDVLGRQVASLASGERQAGRHEVALNASSLANGVYVIRLEVAGQSLIQRVTVSR